MRIACSSVEDIASKLKGCRVNIPVRAGINTHREFVRLLRDVDPKAIAWSVSRDENLRGLAANTTVVNLLPHRLDDWVYIRYDVLETVT
jgi:hypothetical protein